MREEIAASVIKRSPAYFNGVADFEMTREELIDVYRDAVAIIEDNKDNGRKIVALTSDEENCIVAACDDGTVWNINLLLKNCEWLQLPAIPIGHTNKEIQ